MGLINSKKLIRNRLKTLSNNEKRGYSTQSIRKCRKIRTKARGKSRKNVGNFPITEPILLN